MVKYFENSLRELRSRFPDIDYQCKRIDANTFTSVLYYAGKEKSCCTIGLSGKSSFLTGISYSSTKHNDGINESLNVKDDGYMLYLVAQLSFMSPGDKEDKLTYEGASEYYWSRFIEPLQR